MERDQTFLEYVVKSLVDHPDDVAITRTIDEMGVLLTLTVNADDMGKIIGRSGATAKAIRTLLRVVGMKNDARVNLKINEPEGGMRASEPARDRTVDDVLADLDA
ncbi:MAG TPA: KH domain-containing protein [Candidatus Paceibacterota bacterium]|nr:KH domain-containing protein [Candidatus Paceibacterota bacterium]